MWNNDVDISLCRPTDAMDYFFLNGRRATRLSSCTKAPHARDELRRPAVQAGRHNVVVPRGTTYRFRPDGEQRSLVFETPGLNHDPESYRTSTPADEPRAVTNPTGRPPPTDRLPDAPRQGRVRGSRFACATATRPTDHYHPFERRRLVRLLRLPVTFSIPRLRPITRPPP